MLWSMSDRLPIPRQAFWSACVTLAVLGVAELGLRWADQGWSALYAGDPVVHWTLRPNLNIGAVPHAEESTTFPVQTSADGLRDGPIPGSEPWVLALGCSTTFGWGVAASEAWPERLQATLGVEVINAGVPGHSTHQGLRFAGELIDRKPDVVLLGWGLRDGDRASVVDADRRPPPWPERLRITQLLRRIIAPSRSRSSAGQSFRVPPDEFARNMAEAAARARRAGAQPVVVDMTQTAGHKRALRDLGVPIVELALEEGDRFEKDAVHFTAAGNRAIARQVAAVVGPLLNAE